MIASRQCTSSPSRDTFSEKFDTSTGSSKEIAGLKKKKMKNNYYDDRNREIA